jgi:hypothetical protein
MKTIPFAFSLILAVTLTACATTPQTPTTIDESNINQGNDMVENEVTKTGQAICLPHKNVKPGDIVTMECAYGIKAEDGNYSLILSEDKMMDFQVEKTYTVTGAFTPDPKSIYDVVGTIDVNTIAESTE